MTPVLKPFNLNEPAEVGVFKSKVPRNLCHILSEKSCGSHPFFMSILRSVKLGRFLVSRGSKNCKIIKSPHPALSRKRERDR
jgi:hypothetical protein